MNEHPTYATLMTSATHRLVLADLRAATTRNLTAEQARDVLRARQSVAAAARDQVAAMFGTARLSAREWDSRHAPRRPTEDTVVAWLHEARQLRDLDGELADRDAGHVQGYLSARALVRAATDLLATYDRSGGWAGASAPFPPTSLPDAARTPVEFVMLMAHSPGTYLAARVAGVSTREAEHLVTPIVSRPLADAANAVLDLARRVPASGIADRTLERPDIRTDTPGHEWRDRVTAAAYRFTRLAHVTTEPVPVTTLRDMAAIYAANDAVSDLSTWTPRQEHLASVRTQLASWRSIEPEDGHIRGHARRVVAMVKPLRATTDDDYARSLQDAARNCAPLLDECAEMVEQLAARVDRWIPARPTPNYLPRLRRPPYVATRPTEPLLPWNPDRVASIPTPNPSVSIRTQ